MKKNNQDGEKKSRIENLIVRYFEKIQESETPLEPVREKFDADSTFEKTLASIGRYNERRAFRKKLLSVAASVILLAVIGYTYRNKMSNFLKPVALIEKHSDKGKITLLTMKDGTRIWLNADSKIKYSESFGKKRREVTLSGEAYFEVAHKSTPFIVYTQGIKTQVLGTSFNVNARGDEESIKITVLTGRVGVVPVKKKPSDQTVYLTPNQQVEFSKTTRKITVHKAVNATDEILWHEGKLIYKSTPVSKVIADVQRKYNVQIKADSNILQCAISVDLSNKPITQVLRILGEIVNGKADYKQGIYHLSGTGCK